MLTYNTFRSDRYLRTKFVEGRFLLASEGTDLEQEIIDLSRINIKNSLGDVFVGNALKLQYLSSTQVLISDGEAWYRGLPFFLRSAKDELFILGAVPPGVTLTQDTAGRGIIINFTNTTTPTNAYTVVLTAVEQLITSTQDPFLQNTNITETTSQKLRLNYLVNVVLTSVLNESSLPYNSENDGYSMSNLTNDTIVFPLSGQNGELTLTTPVSGAQIDGRSAELTITNNPGLGGGNPLPVSSIDQQSFTNGKLIDSDGTEYHLNAIFQDPSNVNNVILRIDQEFNQPLPRIVNGTSYIVRKRDVYVQDDSTGNPLGKLFLPIGNISWDTTNGVSHASKITDTRDMIVEQDVFQSGILQKFDLFITGGGTVQFDSINQLAIWSAGFNIINPHGATMTIATNSIAVVEGGSLAYLINLAGGAIDKGILPVVITSNAGTTVNLASVDLSGVSVGNAIKIGTQVQTITSINNVSKVLTVDVGFTATGSADIYLDSYGPGYVPVNLDSLILAVRKSNEMWFSPESNGSTGQNVEGSGIGDDLGSLGYLASFRDSFPVSPVITGPVNINAGFTNPTLYSSVFHYYRLNYDASQTVTTSGTNATLSGAPAFTLAVGDMLVAAGKAFRITALSTQTNFTIENTFTPNLSGAACTVSEAVYTVDLNNYAGDGQAISNIFSGNIGAVLLDYQDSSASGDTIFDINVTPNIAYTASVNGTTYSNVQVRPTALTTEEDSLSFTSPGTDLFVRFFANKSSGSGQVNLLSYRAFFHAQSVSENSFAGNQAYCFANASTTPVNCSNPATLGGKSTIALDFSYITNTNPGSPNGQLEIFVNGQKIPRFINSLLTPDSSYTEVDAQTIALDSDYSSYPYAIEIIKPVALDQSASNPPILGLLYEAIVGSASQVSAGLANYSSINSAIAGVSAGAKILVLSGMFTENVIVNKALVIEGKGHNSNIVGTLEFQSTGSFSAMNHMHISGNVTFDASCNAVFFNENWLDLGNTVTDNGTQNYKNYTVG